MPTYEYEHRCNEDIVKRSEIYCPISEYTPTIRCLCGGTMERVFSPPLELIADIQPYKSVVTGEVIGSRAAHREHLKRHGLVEVGNAKWDKRKAVPMPDLKPDLVPVYREVMRRAGKR